MLAVFLGTFGVDRFYLESDRARSPEAVHEADSASGASSILVLIGTGSMRDAQGLVLKRDAPLATTTRSQSTLFLLSYFLGLAGGPNRFYLGQDRARHSQALTCGGLGIWSLIDILMIGMGRFRDAEGNSLRFER